MTADRKDTWAAGNLYEPYVGRWSRLVAREFFACCRASAFINEDFTFERTGVE